MKASSRPILGVVAGVAIFLVGFWIQLHAASFGVYTRADGVSVAPYTAQYHQLADLLLYTGATLGGFSAGVWVCGGLRRLSPAQPV